MKTATNFRKAFAALVIASVMATSSYAQSNNDSSENEKEKQFVEFTKTNENHQLLAGMIGAWSFEGRHISPDPAAKPFVFKGTIVKKAILDGRYFVTETKSDGKLPMPWSAGKLMTYMDMTVEGYDNVTKKFVAANIANETNTGIINYEGTYDPGTRTITYEAQSSTHLHKDLAPGTMMKFRELVKIIDNDHFILEHYEFIDGKEIVLTELKYSRIKSK